MSDDAAYITGHVVTVSGGMNMRTDTADSLQDVEVLHPVAAFGGFFNPAMDVAKPGRCTGDNFAVDGKFKVSRLL